MSKSLARTSAVTLKKVGHHADAREGQHHREDLVFRVVEDFQPGAVADGGDHQEGHVERVDPGHAGAAEALVADGAGDHHQRKSGYRSADGAPRSAKNFVAAFAVVHVGWNDARRRQARIR